MNRRVQLDAVIAFKIKMRPAPSMSDIAVLKSVSHVTVIENFIFFVLYVILLLDFTFD